MAFNHISKPWSLNHYHRDGLIAPNPWWNFYSEEQRWEEILRQLWLVVNYLENVVTPKLDELIDLVNPLIDLVNSFEERVIVLEEFQQNMETVVIPALEQAIQDCRDHCDAALAAEQARAEGVEQALSDGINDERARAEQAETVLNNLISVIQTKLITDYTYNPTTHILTIVTPNQNFSVELPEASAVEDGLFTTALWEKLDRLAKLLVNRGWFADITDAPTTTPDPKFKGGYAEDGDWCWFGEYSDGTTTGSAIMAINVDASDNVTYHFIEWLESDLGIATPGSPGLVAFDNTTIRMNAARELYANIDNDTIFYDVVSGKIKAKVPTLSGAGSTAYSSTALNETQTGTVTVNAANLTSIFGTISEGTVVYDTTEPTREGVITSVNTTTSDTTIGLNAVSVGDVVTIDWTAGAVAPGDDLIIGFEDLEYTLDDGTVRTVNEFQFKPDEDNPLVVNMYVNYNGVKVATVGSLSDDGSIDWIQPNPLEDIVVLSKTGSIADDSAYVVTKHSTVMVSAVVETVQEAETEVLNMPGQAIFTPSLSNNGTVSTTVTYVNNTDKNQLWKGTVTPGIGNSSDMFVTLNDPAGAATLRVYNNGAGSYYSIASNVMVIPANTTLNFTLALSIYNWKGGPAVSGEFLRQRLI